MPRRRKNANNAPRIALPALELESKMMGMLRGLKDCAKLKGVRFVFVGSLGREPNWFAYRSTYSTGHKKRPQGARSWGRPEKPGSLLMQKASHARPTP
jgi:hypothetical protein